VTGRWLRYTGRPLEQEASVEKKGPAGVSGVRNATLVPLASA